MAGDAWRSRLGAAGGSIRWRVTVTAVGVVGMALVVGVAAMLAFLRRANEDQVRVAAQLRAREITAVIEAGEAPGKLTVDDDEEVLIQVVDRAGRVVAASPNIIGLPPVVPVAVSVEPGEAGARGAPGMPGVRVAPGRSVRIAATPIEDEPAVVAAQRARGPDGTYTVLVARTITDDSTDAVASLFRIGIPLLLGLVGVTTWRAARRALAPVDAIRAEVDAISAAELTRRVPSPPGRDEIARLALTMNRMLDRLEAAQRTQRRFVADASHELRSPLAIIRQHAEVALAHPERADVARLARNVLAEDVRMQHLVDNLLVLVRADEGILGLDRRPVDLDDLVFEVSADLRRSSTLQIDTTAVSAGRVVGDEGQLRRIVRNLADNAVRHARSRVVFSLTEDTPAGSTRLRVDDDGAGIPAADRRRIFERFVRLDDARSRDAGGSGLGLAIVAEIVATHGGSVTVGDSPLGGARFEVLIPANP